MGRAEGVVRELIERKKDREIKVRKSVQWLETQKDLTSSTSKTLVTPTPALAVSIAFRTHLCVYFVLFLGI